ncbi:RLP7 Ribosome biogenesis protein RLP7 [Candida maltosa Xu316]|uniref:Ribosome biogenesis protein, putative n=1 Tax=Candida maltosa (strain Xu316) TaxID=1245528 RepID=M3K261_CANMX|nr:Ribosome biogenesis protein, putative [Candida maltosa Xu316]
MAILNSNPEILLRKRKNADRKRLEKQEQIRENQILKKSAKKRKATKFVRAETLISNHKSNELERKRIKNLTKKQKKLQEEESTDSDYKLLFVIRIPNHTKGLKIPTKAYQILQVLKLTATNTGVFIKANKETLSLLTLIAPYVLVGTPSLNSIRKLFQKRARIMTIEKNEETEEDEEKVIKLDNNQLVEDKFGDELGLLCIEDLIIEIFNKSENFLKITGWLLPFKLNAPVNGWGPQAKLQRLIKAEENKVKISLAQDFKLQEVEDMDKIIDEQN